MDCNLPGSSVHGISQARILEWLPFPSPGSLPDPGSPVLQEDYLPSEPPRKSLTLPGSPPHSLITNHFLEPPPSNANTLAVGENVNLLGRGGEVGSVYEYILGYSLWLLFSSQTTPHHSSVLQSSVISLRFALAGLLHAYSSSQLLTILLTFLHPHRLLLL